MNGQVVRILKDKGFGFIRGENNTEYFFHQSAVKNAKFMDIKEGQDVKFEDSEGSKGPRAENIFV